MMSGSWLRSSGGWAFLASCWILGWIWITTLPGGCWALPQNVLRASTQDLKNGDSPVLGLSRRRLFVLTVKPKKRGTPKEQNQASRSNVSERHHQVADTSTVAKMQQWWLLRVCGHFFFGVGHVTQNFYSFWGNISNITALLHLGLYLLLKGLYWLSPPVYGWVAKTIIYAFQVVSAISMSIYVKVYYPMAHLQNMLYRQLRRQMFFYLPRTSRRSLRSFNRQLRQRYKKIGSNPFLDAGYSDSPSLFDFFFFPFTEEVACRFLPMLFLQAIEKLWEPKETSKDQEGSSKSRYNATKFCSSLLFASMHFHNALSMSRVPWQGGWFKPDIIVAKILFGSAQFTTTLILALYFLVPLYEQGGLAASYGGHLAWNIWIVVAANILHFVLRPIQKIATSSNS